MPNPALDVTVVAPDAAAGVTTRARQTFEGLGGKPFHAPTVAHALGARVRVIAPLGGERGARVAEHAEQHGVDLVAVPIRGQTRRTYTVVDERRGAVLEVIEPSPTLTADEVAVFERSAVEAIADAAVVIIGGSLPGGVHAALFSAVVDWAHAAGAVAIVDAGGDALVQCLPSVPDLITPNAGEAADALGVQLPGAASTEDLAEVAERLQRRGAAVVCVTAGAKGSVVSTPRASWHVTLEADVAINAVGCGDALVGGAGAALATGMSSMQAIVLGTAAAASKLAHAEPDHVDPEEVRRWQHEVHVEPLSRRHVDRRPAAVAAPAREGAR